LRNCAADSRPQIQRQVLLSIHQKQQAARWVSILREQPSAPVGLAAELPLSLARCAQPIAELALIRTTRTTARRDLPGSIAPTTRSRRSGEWAAPATISDANNATRLADAYTPENLSATIRRS